MFKTTCSVLLLLLLSQTTCPQIIDQFSILSVREETNISHTRIYFAIDTRGAMFPYRNSTTGAFQAGWRIYLSPYTIPDDDPQFAITLWNLPNKDRSMSQVFWIVKPEGLVGPIHVRIDAIDATRTIIARSLPYQHVFDNTLNGGIKTSVLPWVVSAPDWSTSVVLVNPNPIQVSTSLAYRTMVGVMAHMAEVTLQPFQIHAFYVNDVFVTPFHGSIELLGDHPVYYQVIMVSEDNVRLTYTGKTQ